MKVAGGLLGIGLFIVFLAGIMWALGNFRGVDFTEPHILTTTSNQTSTNIRLANSVLDDDNTNISIISNNDNDAPIPYAYTAVNKTLNVTGLNPSDNRTLTITYKVPRLDSFTDFSARFFPSVLIIGCILAVIGIVVTAFRH